MAWNPSPEVAAARDYGNKFGHDQVIILFVDREGRVSYASWGRTRSLCDATKLLADAALEAVEDAAEE